MAHPQIAMKFPDAHSVANREHTIDWDLVKPLPRLTNDNEDTWLGYISNDRICRMRYHPKYEMVVCVFGRIVRGIQDRIHVEEFYALTEAEVSVFYAKDKKLD